MITANRRYPPLALLSKPPPDLKSSSNTVSQLTHPSDTDAAALASPTGAKGIGIPATPGHWQFGVTDASAYEDGYNSEGQPAPWEGPDIIDPNNLMLFEDPLQVGFPPFPPLEPIVKNVVQNLLGVPHMLKLKVEEMKKELKNRGLLITWNKKELQQRLEAVVV